MQIIGVIYGVYESVLFRKEDRLIKKIIGKPCCSNEELDLIDKKETKCKVKKHRALCRLHQFFEKLSGRMKGSITMEAAVVLPIFLLAVSHLVYWLNYLDVERNLSEEVNQKGRRMAIESFALDQDEDEPIEITKGASLRGSYFVRLAKVRPFTGRYYDETLRNSDENKLVFITKNGSVFHRSLLCSHIKLSIKKTGKDRIKGLRNKNGEKYKPCEFCNKKFHQGAYFITEYGDRYHSKRNCKGLRRKIRIVNLKVARELGFGSCKKCGGYHD